MSNRAQRRAAEKAKKNGFTSRQANYLAYIAQREAYEYTDKIYDETVEKLTPRFMAMFALVLHDDFGFGKQRLGRVLGRVYELSDAIEHGYLTLDDILRTLKEEHGIEL